MPTPRSPAQPKLQGAALLRDAAANRGTAFSAQARDALGLQGLLPPAIETPGQQVARVMDNVRRQATDLDRYVYLSALRERSETLFYRAVFQHLGEALPLVYTPTVGQACQAFGRIFQAPRGLYITAQDRGHIRDILRHWPQQQVRVIVVTDGSASSAWATWVPMAWASPLASWTCMSPAAVWRPRPACR